MSVTSFAAARLIRALPRVTLSKAVGRLCEQSLPAPVSHLVERLYCSAYEVNLDEAEDRGPYPNFDAFFTRNLRAGVRPIAESAVVAPADGYLSAMGPVDPGARITVKKQNYDVGELVGSAEEARRYRGGAFAVVYLAPSDYHRVHAPVDGSIDTIVGIPGDLFPVNSIGENHIHGLFVRNNRVSMRIDTESLGRVNLVMVGATIVGRISVTAIPEPAVPPGETSFTPGRTVRRGDEIGVFHLGSTVVMLFEPGVALDRPFGKVRMGESLRGT